MNARKLALAAFAACVLTPAAFAKTADAMASAAPVSEASLHNLDPAAKLLADPRFAEKISAARAELGGR